MRAPKVRASEAAYESAWLAHSLKSVGSKIDLICISEPPEPGAVGDGVRSPDSNEGSRRTKGARARFSATYDLISCGRQSGRTASFYTLSRLFDSPGVVDYASVQSTSAKTFLTCPTQIHPRLSSASPWPGPQYWPQS